MPSLNFGNSAIGGERPHGRWSRSVTSIQTSVRDGVSENSSRQKIGPSRAGRARRIGWRCRRSPRVGDVEQPRVGPFGAIARRSGELYHSAHSADPIDAAVVLNATGTTSVIATSDPKDMRQLIRALPSQEGSAITVLRV